MDDRIKGLAQFDVPLNQKKAFNKIILQKLLSDERVNVYFSFNYSHPNYYFLAQLFYLSFFGKFKNAHVYLSFADTVVAARGHSLFPAPLTEHNDSVISSKMDECKAILNYFGFPLERLHMYKATDNWISLAKLSPECIRRFYIGMSVLPESAMSVPKKTSELYYLPEKSKYLLVLAIQKYLDLFVAFNFDKIFPEETKQGIDLFLLGHYSAPITFNLKKLMSTEGIISGDSPLIILPPKVPCFGHNMLVDKRFVIPDWNMKVEEIFGIIDKYNVETGHIKQIFDNLLRRTQKSFISFEKRNAVETEQAPDVSKHPYETQKKLLALNLHSFLQEAKKGCTIRAEPQYLHISESARLKGLAKLLRGELALKILDLSTGNYTITEIARRLDKHVSNVSSMVHQLSDQGLVEVRPDKKVYKKIKTIKIDF